MELAQEADLEEIFSLINDAYILETGNEGVAFKKTPRFTTIDEARTYLDHLWILRKEGSKEIMGSIYAKVVGDIVYIGPVAVKVGFQNQGIGSKLFDFGENLAAVPQIEVVSCRSDLFPFYFKRGYVQTKAYPIQEYVPEERLTRHDLQMIEMKKLKK